MRKIRYKRVVDNKMKDQGETDTEKKVIRINKVKSKKKSTVIDTIVHEEGHAKSPRKHEKTIRKETPEKVKRMTQKQKSKLYSRYRKSR